MNEEDSRPAGRLVNTQYVPQKDKNDIYDEGRMFRVCAYCRVSTDSEMQATSFELQCEHYRNLTKEHPNWDLKKVYADEGISGTSLNRREQFNEMMNACMAGEYDLVITKSVSRFARNTVDSLSCVRKLKQHTPPVGVFFELENLYTLSGTSELILTMVSTIAQEESVNKSDSMNWSLRQRFKSGKLLIPELYGYTRERDASGRYLKSARLEIIEEEAKIVRFIYDAFLLGYPPKGICELLNDLGIPTKTGLDKWNAGTIRYILSNERYCGSVLTWKTFTWDVLNHKKRKTMPDDREQYIYDDDHAPIISQQKFEAVQELMMNRRHGVDGFPVMHVIHEGIFRGYIPVNHHWVNENPESYIMASGTVSTEEKVQKIQKSHFSAFALDGYQVVRGQFSTRRPECPCMTISSEKICFNKTCLRKFNETKYIQLLVHPSERKLAIRPCRKNDIYSILWRKSEREQNSKILSCRFFSKALFQMMSWNPGYQYQIRGTWASQGRYEIIVFDVTKALSAMQTIVDEDVTVKTKRGRKVYLCPEEWDFSFGDEFYDFSMQNSFYYIQTSTWKADAESEAIEDSTLPRLPTREEFISDLQTLKEGKEKYL